MRRFWSELEDEYLRRYYATTDTSVLARVLERSDRAIYTRAQRQGLRKSLRYRADLRRRQVREVQRFAVATRFKKGRTPWNKGKHFDPGGRSSETRFKPANKPQTWVPVGSETRDPDGYLKRKVRDDAPAGMSRLNWKFVHVLVWEEANGSVPRGHAVAFKNGDKDHITLDNLELVSRRELMARNTVHRYPEELKRVIRAKAALTRKINEENSHA